MEAFARGLIVILFFVTHRGGSPAENDIQCRSSILLRSLSRLASRSAEDGSRSYGFSSLITHHLETERQAVVDLIDVIGVVVVTSRTLEEVARPQVTEVQLIG